MLAETQGAEVEMNSIRVSLRLGVPAHRFRLRPKARSESRLRAA